MKRRPQELRLAKRAMNRTGITVLASLIVGLVSFCVYLPALENGFVNWDDVGYVLKNRVVHSLTLNSFIQTFTDTFLSNWHPLTVLSWSLDNVLWGLDPMGFHLTNIVLHSLNTILILWVSLRLLAYWPETLENENGQTLLSRKPSVSIIGASVTALLFGLHPIQTESVVWISERKNLLFAVFYLGSIIAYLNYVEATGRRWSHYVASILLFGLSLMSKAMAVSLPCVLLILDAYPLRRISRSNGTLRLLVEKLPYVVLAVAASVVALQAQHGGGAMASSDILPLSFRLAVACKTIFFYIYQIIIPKDLFPFYPYPSPTAINMFSFAGYVALIIGLSLFALFFRRRYPLLLACWVFFLVTLTPILGVVQVGSQAAADRYAYISSLGLFFPFVIVLMKIRNRLPGAFKHWAWILPAALILTCAVRTIHQTAIWKDSLTLWNHQISRGPEGTPLPYVMRGNAYKETGSYDKAIQDYDTATRIHPQNIDAIFNRAHAYQVWGLYSKAIKDYTRAIELTPQDPEAYFNRGGCYLSLGRNEKAMQDFQQALVIQPGYAKAYFGLGSVSARRGELETALKYYRRAAELGMPEAREYLSRFAGEPPP